VTSAEQERSLLRAVAEVMGLEPVERAEALVARFPDPARRAAAERLLRACERAAEHSLFSAPAADLAAPIVRELEEAARPNPQTLGAALAGRYAIERELGRGGQATVYLARDERHRRQVALKVLSATALPDGSPARGVAWFRREIELAARLTHPHILPVHDSGIADGRLFYVTPFVDGASLRDHLAGGNRLALDQALRVLRDVCRALAYAHRHGVIHRDIKPANILISREGDALVGDFGVARGLAAATEPATTASADPVEVATDLTDAGLVIGTPTYLSPEQAAGMRSIDHRADLYGLGVVAYELLTGVTPFAGATSDDLLAAHLSQAPLPVRARVPNVSPALAGLVDRLIAKRPDDRPRDAAEVLQVLDDELGNLRATDRRVIAPDSSGREAIGLYQKGRFLLGMRQRDTLFSAIQYFERALALDPAYARAHAAVGDAYALLGVFGHLEPREAFDRSREAAERALAMDDRLAEAHATLAHHLFVYQWNWQEAGPALERAVALDPGYPMTRMFHASYLHSVGRSEDALTQLAVVHALDPLHPAAVLSGRIYVDTHRPDDAIRVLQEVLELDPRRDLAHELLAHAFLQKQQHADAVASMRRAATLSGARDSAQLAYVLAATGETVEARQILERLHAGSAPLHLLGFHLGMAYAGLGDTDEAFLWLDEAIRVRGGFMNLLAVSHGFDAIRPDARFTRLLQQIGLVSYARG
jgi:tetratricopeptide (TPR) repeat protein